MGLDQDLVLHLHVKNFWASFHSSWSKCNLLQIGTITNCRAERLHNEWHMFGIVMEFYSIIRLLGPYMNKNVFGVHGSNEVGSLLMFVYWSAIYKLFHLNSDMEEELWL